MKIKNTLFFRLFKIFSLRVRFLAFITLCLLIITSSLETLVIRTAFPMVNSFLDIENFDQNNLNFEGFQFTVLKFISAIIIVSIMKFLTLKSIARLSKITCTDISNRCVRSFIGVEGFLESSSLTFKEQLNQCTQDIDQLHQFINSGMWFLLQIFSASTIIIALIIISSTSALISLSSVCAAFFLITRLRKKYIEKNALKQFLSNQNLTEIASSAILDKKEIQTYEAQKSIAQEFFTESNRKFIAMSNLMIDSGMPRLILEPLAFSSVLLPLIFLLNNLDGNSGRYFLTAASTLLFGLVRLLPVIQQLYASFNSYKRTSPPVKLILKSIDDFNNFKFKVNKSLNKNNEISKIDNLKIINISCRNFNNDGEIFKPKNFNLYAGESLVITGPSGCGKSSLLESICGLRKEAFGEILIEKDRKKNIIKLGGYDRSWAINKFAYVPQKPYIFDSTIENNIKMFSPLNKLKNEFYLEILDICKVKSFLERLTNKDQTKINMQTNKLSGGQVQRIAIARALASMRPIILLDECTSALDQELSFNIIKDIIHFAKKHKRIVLGVNHNPSIDDLFSKKLDFREIIN